MIPFVLHHPVGNLRNSNRLINSLQCVEHSFKLKNLPDFTQYEKNSHIQPF